MNASIAKKEEKKNAWEGIQKDSEIKILNIL